MSRCCYSVFIIVFAILLFRAEARAIDSNTLFINGQVKESVFKSDLPRATVWTIGDNGERVDSLPLGEYMTMHMGGENSQFTLITSRRDSLYVFEVGCDGYIPQTITYRVENAGNDWKRDIPTIYLDRAPHKLGEVTVTASKVKFYHRGDTLVYNADAFQLAEGSMLDGLIKQLPGARISDDGRITINGEFVETLLLDGKPFFDGNNNLMLKNLGAYMVKNVELYRGQTDMEKFMDNPDVPKHLTMNVKLRKEYNMGVIANVQAGYGTDDRYLGRLFAAWFNRTARIGIMASINNLDDTRTPGENDSWTPEQSPSGTRKYNMAGLSYNVGDATNTKSLDGNVTYENNILNSRANVNRINFINSGNTYDYGYRFSHDKDISVATRHNFKLTKRRVSVNGNAAGGYDRHDRDASALSASYDREQRNVTLQMLEAIYGSGASLTSRYLINRSSTASDAEMRKGNAEFNINTLYKITSTGDMLRVTASVKYDSHKERLWNDYDIGFGYDSTNDAATETDKRRNYTDNSPNHEFRLDGSVIYMKKLNKLGVDFGYNYAFDRHLQDSYMYALDRLADMGVYGSLPAGYLSAFDPSNSFTSMQWDNRHSAIARIGYNDMRTDRIFSVNGGMRIGAQHSRMNYFSDGNFYPVRRNSMIAVVAAMSTRITYVTIHRGDGKASNSLLYDYSLDTETPNLLHTVDVINNSDPLNIDLGNHDLKNAYSHRHQVEWRNYKGSRFNHLRVNVTHTTNAIVRGFTYDTQTGVRYNRSYNVKGTCSLDASDTYSLQFGNSRQFTISSTTGAGFNHFVDMTGEISGGDVTDPVPVKVNNRVLSETMKLSWQTGRQSLSLDCGVTDNHTSRSRYAAISATHYRYGVQGKLSLPAGFGLSTDFTCYTRRGYGEKTLDTTDAVWNAGVSYTPRGGHWVIAVDGFDLLHQLDNVNYAVTATGRTVTVVNTIPRYVLASVQYRFNIAPKRR